MPEALLSARGVTVRFGGLVAVDGVDFDVHAGELAGIIGPNGAGKTTFVHTLSGVIAPSAGRVVVAGDDLTGRAPHAFARIQCCRRNRREPRLLWGSVRWDECCGTR